MRNPEYIIKIAADNVARLRQVDVFRVLENCDADELNATAQYITAKRPELFAEVNSCIAYLI